MKSRWQPEMSVHALDAAEGPSFRPQNILHVIPSVSLVHGGPSRAIVAMEQALAAAGAHVTTVTTDDDGPSRRLSREDRPDEVNGARRIYVAKRLEFYKIAPGLVPWLWRNVRNFDVVHIHALFSFTSIAAGIAARLNDVPYVIRPLGTLSSYGVTQRRPWLKRLSLRFVEGPILKGAAYVHCTSEAELEEARALGLRFNGGVIPLGVEPPTASPPMVEDTKNGARADADVGLKVLYLSRLDPKKNIEGLLDAFADVARDRPGLRLEIAGDGPSEYVAGLKDRAASLSIERRIAWLGHVDGAVKAATLAGADVFVLPSHSENFGIAAVEAMLAGLPCVLGAGVGIADEVRAAGAGYMVGPEPAAISVALARLLDDAEERDRVGRRARDFAEQHYSTAAMAQRLITLYTSFARTGRERSA